MKNRYLCERRKQNTFGGFFLFVSIFPIHFKEKMQWLELHEWKSFIFLNISKLEAETEVLDLSWDNAFSHVSYPYFFIKESSEEEKKLNLPKLCDSPITNLKQHYSFCFIGYTKEMFYCMSFNQWMWGEALPRGQKWEQRKGIYNFQIHESSYLLEA